MSIAQPSAQADVPAAASRRQARGLAWALERKSAMSERASEWGAIGRAAIVGIGVLVALIVGVSFIQYAWLLLACGGIVLTARAVYYLVQVRTVKQWPQTAAEIVGMRVSEKLIAYQYHFERRYFPEVLVRYNVLGKIQEAATFGRVRGDFWSKDKEKAEALLAPYRAARQVMLYVNPTRGKVVALVPGMSRYAASVFWAQLLAGVLLLLISICAARSNAL